jgi:hypothetical protein
MVKDIGTVKEIVVKRQVKTVELVVDEVDVKVLAMLLG